MNILSQMSQEAQRLGFIKGESAADWRERDPKAATEFAAWLKANKQSVVKAVSGIVCAS